MYSHSSIKHSTETTLNPAIEPRILNLPMLISYEIKVSTVYVLTIKVSCFNKPLSFKT